MFIKTCFVNTACVGWTHCTDFPLRCIILLDQTIINYLSGKTFPIQHFFLPSMVKYKAKISDNRLVFYRNFINKRQWKASTTQNTFLINLREGFTEHCSPNTKKKNEQKKLQSRERIVAAFNHGSISYSWWTALGRSSLKNKPILRFILKPSKIGQMRTIKWYGIKTK